MIKADLKHWGGRRSVKGPYEINYKTLARQAYSKLGEGGIVGVPNARGEDNPLGAEYRFEELFEIAKKESSITPLEDGRVFHDNLYNIWFVKAQEINSTFNGKKLVYLAYNIQFGKNYKESNNEALDDSRAIRILNLPSCIRQVENEESTILFPWEFFSGVVVHSSVAAILGKANQKAGEVYNEFVQTGYKNIGAVALSGGHRTQEEGLLQKIVSPISIGSSYSIFSDFKGGNLTEFCDWLKASIENSQNTSNLVKGSAIRETAFQHLPRMIQGVINKERKTIF